jgi:hypothetical protein
LEPTPQQRREVLERLGDGQIPDGEEQRFLLNLPGRLLKNAAQGDELAFARCEAALWKQRARRLAPQPEARSSRTRPHQLLGGTNAEQWHADRISEHIGSVARESEEATEFRVWLFGDANAPPLSPAAAHELLRSPLLRYAMKEDLDRWGIPLQGHQAEIMNPVEAVENPRRISGGVEGAPREDVEIRVSWSGGERVSTFGTEVPEPRHYLEFPGTGGRRAAVEVWPFSVLGTIRWHADRLTEMAAPCAAWWASKLGAGPSTVWYLLTGIVPKIPAVSVHWEVPGSEVDAVTITALSHVSPDSVRNAYAIALRRQAGGRPTPSRRRALQLFVEGKIAENGKRPPWLRLWREWNKGVPWNLRYASWRNMCRDYGLERECQSTRHDGLTYQERQLVVVESEIRASRGELPEGRAVLETANGRHDRDGGGG